MRDKLSVFESLGACKWNGTQITAEIGAFATQILSCQRADQILRHVECYDPSDPGVTL